MKIFILYFVLIYFTNQELVKNIEDLSYDPLFTIVKKNKKHLKKNHNLQQKNKIIKKEKFIKPPTRNLQVFQTDEDGKLLNGLNNETSLQSQTPKNRNLASQINKNYQKKTLEDFKRLMSLAQEFEQDPYFKVKVSVKYQPKKLLHDVQQKPIRRKLKQLKSKQKYNQNISKRKQRKMKMPKNFYL